MNMIGRCIVSGNIRRTAEIAFGEPDDEEFINLKNYDLNPERMKYGWVSNNSVSTWSRWIWYITKPRSRVVGN